MKIYVQIIDVRAETYHKQKRNTTVNFPQIGTIDTPQHVHDDAILGIVCEFKAWPKIYQM